MNIIPNHSNMTAAERVVKHATCACGQSVLIEFNAKYSSRRDRKRVFYADSPDNLCAFRCRGCHAVVSDCVPGAEYDERPTGYTPMTGEVIKITLNQIKVHLPCESGWKKLLIAQGKTKADDVPFPMADILDSNGLEDCLWAMRCLPHNNLWRKYAVWCARQVEHLMKDERSLKALDVAWRHSEGMATDEELKISRVAAYAAADADDYAAYAAAIAAYAVADAAAYGAVRAARATRAAADDASEMKKQADKLREILNAGQWVGEQK